MFSSNVPRKDVSSPKKSYPRISEVIYTRDKEEKDCFLSAILHLAFLEVSAGHKSIAPVYPPASLPHNSFRDLRRSCITLAAPRSRSVPQSFFN